MVQIRSSWYLHAIHGLRRVPGFDLVQDRLMLHCTPCKGLQEGSKPLGQQHPSSWLHRIVLLITFGFFNQTKLSPCISSLAGLTRWCFCSNMLCEALRKRPFINLPNNELWTMRKGLLCPVPLLQQQSLNSSILLCLALFPSFQRQENILTLSCLVEIKDWCKLCCVKFGVFSSRWEDNWILFSLKEKIRSTLEENALHSNAKNLHPERNLFMWKQIS